MSARNSRLLAHELDTGTHHLIPRRGTSAVEQTLPEGESWWIDTQPGCLAEVPLADGSGHQFIAIVNGAVWLHQPGNSWQRLRRTREDVIAGNPSTGPGGV